MLAAGGSNVPRLVRVAIGGVSLGALEKGAARPLEVDELVQLRGLQTPTNGVRPGRCHTWKTGEDGSLTSQNMVPLCHILTVGVEKSREAHSLLNRDCVRKIGKTAVRARG